MGHRANLILVDNTGYRLFYCHWCANTIPQDIFWGPDIAQAYIAQQQPCPDMDCWLDETWSEGGAVIDPTKKQLLVYGGGDIQYDVPLRRLLLNLMRHVWTGWDIQWAHAGIWDMAQYVGYPAENVHDSQNLGPGGYDELLTTLGEANWAGTIASIRFDDGSLQFFALDDLIDEWLIFGERLIVTMLDKAQQTKIVMDTPDQEFPMSGFHIDMPAKKLSLWSADEKPAIDLLRQHWPGWEIDWLKDNFETHLALTNNRLRFPVVSDEQLVSRLETILLSEKKGALPGFLSLLDKLKEEGKEATVNPNALHENPLELAEERRHQIFNDAVEAWKQTH